MEFRSLISSNGSLLYSPCNGCEFCNGSLECKICIENLTRYFISLHTEFDFSKPIYPLSL
nr:MAG TPA: hypothetical protein [Caudoviricetes sp.]